MSSSGKTQSAASLFTTLEPRNLSRVSVRKAFWGTHRSAICYFFLPQYHSQKSLRTFNRNEKFPSDFYSGEQTRLDKTTILFGPRTEKKTLRKDNTTYKRYQPPKKQLNSLSNQEAYGLIKIIKQVLSLKNKQEQGCQITPETGAITGYFKVLDESKLLESSEEN